MYGIKINQRTEKKPKRDGSDDGQVGYSQNIPENYKKIAIFEAIYTGAQKRKKRKQIKKIEE